MLLSYLICFVLLIIPTASHHDEDAMNIIVKASRLLEQEQPVNAIELMTKLLERKDLKELEWIAASGQRALAYLLANEKNRALKETDGMVKKYPQNTFCHALRGKIRWNLNNRQEALVDYDQAIRLEPKNDGALFDRGLIHGEMRSMELAFRDAAEIEKQRPNHWRGPLLRCNLHLMSFEYAKVIELAGEWSKKEPAITDFHLLLGHAYADQSQEKDAIKAYEAFFRDQRASYLKAAELLYQGSDSPRFQLQALVMVTKYIEKYPVLDDGYYLRAKVHIARVRWQDALDDYSKALDFAQEKKAKCLLYWNRAIAQRAVKKFKEAIADYEMAIQIEETNPNPHTGLAWYLATLPDAQFRDGKKALVHAQRALELNQGKSSNDMENVAAAYAELGDFTEAVSWQQKALDNNNRLVNREKAEARLKLYQAKKPYRDMSEYGE